MMDRIIRVYDVEVFGEVRTMDQEHDGGHPTQLTINNINIMDAINEINQRLDLIESRLPSL